MCFQGTADRELRLARHATPMQCMQSITLEVRYASHEVLHTIHVCARHAYLNGTGDSDISLLLVFEDSVEQNNYVRGLPRFARAKTPLSLNIRKKNISLDKTA